MASNELPPHLDPRPRHRGSGSSGGGARALRPLGRTLGAILSIGLLALSGYVWYTFRQINNNVPRRDVAVGSKPSGTEKDIDGKDQNLLIIGNDDRSNMTNAEVKELHVGRDGGSLATDTMMVVHVPADGAKATLISLPRDSYVKIPGYGMDKLNAAYADAYTHTTGTTDAKQTAGANLLINTVTNLTGLTIDHYIQVNLLGFVRISNAIGGIPINLCHAVDDTVKANGGDGGSGLVLSKGKHTIKGVQALEFVRQRHGLPGGDLDRVKRQQYFLTAAFRKVASVGILTKLNALGDAINESIFVDKSLNLLDLAKQLENLSANNIIGKTIPTTPETLNDGTSILAVKPAKVQAFVQKVINGPTPAPTSSTSGTTAPTSSSAAGTSASTSASASTALDAKCVN